MAAALVQQKNKELCQLQEQLLESPKSKRKGLKKQIEVLDEEITVLLSQREVHKEQQNQTVSKAEPESSPCIPCEYCNRTFRDILRLERHVRIVHEDEDGEEGPGSPASEVDRWSSSRWQEQMSQITKATAM